MKVVNIHERELDATAEQVGALVDSLASAKDALWPRHSWPPMKLDCRLGVGSAGGHGPIRYFVEEYLPGKSVKFRFTGPRGFNGSHGYEIVGEKGSPVVLRHILKMSTQGPALLSWPLVFRPLHDALIEDSLATAEASLGQAPQIKHWSRWVRILRWVVTGGKTRPQIRLERKPN